MPKTRKMGVRGLFGKNVILNGRCYVECGPSQACKMLLNNQDQIMFQHEMSEIFQYA